ncbi:uncharacterized protein LOC124843362 [Vigna umbellata]|uniref:Uncharacterized protein n=2 Tax=Phaseolus angularis TaxID=3914 RepID=A0A0L9UDM1_PHAAN|nr:uncharacterized protein LOC108330271 [Vigna angularis]XP_047176087.1 uncharacterized protein LOC124843362 [Vigna umbellata]KAG2399625.1 uncharacterized protein HKW66_Vig0105220 [Vigna angularis]KOM40647.1 hypothetical protein LR48_Vigan04g084500 [Vigna angularis]BAT78891.1 hypothetical protein VIGAN_02164600 [Vigna angularis var. angularis]
MLLSHALPLLNSIFDLVTVTFISGLIILSVLSISFIFHLRLKSKSLTHLQNFNSLWTVRFLLVLFIFLWSITELLRLPFFRRKYIYTFLPTFTISQQANLCKVHIVLSLGFFEPAFLVTLLFLLNASIKKKTPNDAWAITFVLLICLPIATLQALLISFSPLENRVPVETSVIFNDGYGFDTVLCTHPFLTSVAFAVFGITYCTWFLFSCWRVLSLVINKGLRVRIYVLASIILVAVPLQIISLGFSVLWSPHQEVYGIVSLVAFLSAFCCATIGEGILVIKPISDALDAGGDCCIWSPRQLPQLQGSVVLRLEGPPT